MNPTPTPPDDLMVAGTTYRRNGFGEWCAVSPDSGELHVAYQESDCLDEIARLRATLAWLIETEAVMWTSDAVYQHGYGSSTIPAPDEIITVLREVDRP